MGNCVSGGEKQEGAVQVVTKEVTDSSVASTVSASSPKAARLPAPMFCEFTAINTDPVVLSDRLRSVSDPQGRSLVVLNAKTGLVILSVARVSPKQFSVFTPDGSQVGTILVMRSTLELKTRKCTYKAVRDQTAIRLYANNTELCRVTNDCSTATADSIQRGVDLVVAFVLAAVARL